MRSVAGNALTVLALTLCAGGAATGQDQEAMFALKIAWKDKATAAVKLADPPDLVVEKVKSTDAAAVHLIAKMDVVKGGQKVSELTVDVGSDLALKDKITVTTRETGTWKNLLIFAGKHELGETVRVALYRAKKLRLGERRDESDRLTEWLELPVKK